MKVLINNNKKTSPWVAANNLPRDFVRFYYVSFNLVCRAAVPHAFVVVIAQHLEFVFSFLFSLYNFALAAEKFPPARIRLSIVDLCAVSRLATSRVHQSILFINYTYIRSRRYINIIILLLYRAKGNKILKLRRRMWNRDVTVHADCILITRVSFVFCFFLHSPLGHQKLMTSLGYKATWKRLFSNYFGDICISVSEREYTHEGYFSFFLLCFDSSAA